MQTHLALLRGINVSGTKMIKMDALSKALQTIGFLNVQTYIQSGNVFVDSAETSSKVSFMIKQEIFKTFGHDVPIIMVSYDDLKSCLVNNLFLSNPTIDLKMLYVAFVSKELNENSIHDLKTSNFKPDEVQIDKNKIYIKYHIGAGKTKLDANYIEKKLNSTATIRNWNTINKMLELYEQR